MSTLSDSNLIAFKAISNFTTELASLFGDKQKSLKLYSRLISKTTFIHEVPISKHITAFRSFCIANRQALIEKDALKFTQKKIEYSERVYMNIHDILKISDTHTKDAIWKHLLVISAILDPAGKAKEMLANSETTEANFLTDILSKVEGEFDPEAGPMEAMSSIMQSGVFTELISNMNSGLQDGTLDLPKLMETVQGMVSGLSEQNGKDGEGSEAINMINTMMGSMATQVEDSKETGQPPDIMAMMGPMLAGMGGDVDGTDGAPNPMAAMMANMGPMLASLGASGEGGGGEPGQPPNIMAMMGPMLSGLGGNKGGISEAIEAQVAAAEARGELPSSARSPSITELSEVD
jgi:hypothetical protein